MSLSTMLKERYRHLVLPMLKMKKRYAQIVISQMNKKKAISIRLLESDLECIKAKSLSQSLPYQTLISILVQQYAIGKIKLDA